MCTCTSTRWENWSEFTNIAKNIGKKKNPQAVWVAMPRRDNDYENFLHTIKTPGLATGGICYVERLA